MIEMFNKFPREIGCPERFSVNSLQEFLAFVNKNNGKKTLFTSVYEFDKNHPEAISIDKIFFDFDRETSFESLKKLHNWCKANKYRHTMFFSGGGCHLYMFTKNYEALKNKKQTLYNCHHFIAEKSKLTIGDYNSDKEGIDYDIDWHIIGDIRRHARIPGTFNMNKKRYCIGITEEDLEKDYSYLKEKAKKPSLAFTYYGNKFFDVKPFDCLLKEYTKPLPYKASDTVKVNKDEVLVNLPLCLKLWLNRDHVGWKRRGWIIEWMRDKGLWRKELNEPLPAMFDETLDLMKKYLEPREFKHMNSNADGFQVKYLYFFNTNNSFPTCNNIKACGECPLKMGEFCKERAMFKNGD